MEEYVKRRPKKILFAQAKQDVLREKAIIKILNELLPDTQILKVVLIGSSVKGSFGMYELPGFRGSVYSDFDFIVFVKDEYEIPHWLQREPDGKPFPERQQNLAYRQKKWLDDMYDAEIFFVRRSTWENTTLQNLGEAAGIPMTQKSLHKHLVIYET